MINQQILQGSWNEISGKIQQKWGQLTRDELRQVQGNIDQLIGLIQRKTGESREAVEHFLDDLTARTSETVGRVTEVAREYASQATEQVRQGAERVADGMRTGYARAESMVQHRPAESVAVSFAAGMVAGVLVGLLINSRS